MAAIPSFLRRALRLCQARRALVRGAPEEALDHLRDPSLVLSRRAEWMRSRTLEELCRCAARRAAEGRDTSTARILAMVQSEDPERARAWRRELVPAPEPDGGGARASHSGESTRDALRGLLDELRDMPRPTNGEAAPPTTAPVPTAARAAAERPQAVGDARLARLVVDDGGEALVALGRDVTIGHLRSHEAELVFLADVEARHARLSWRESFHAGAGWRVEPLAGAVEVDGRAVPVEGQALADGARVVLAQNLVLVFRQPDPSSGAAVLELQGGVECHGAARVLLCVPGAGGRLAMGRGARCHIAVRSLEHELSLEAEEPAAATPDPALAMGPADASGPAHIRFASDDGVRVTGGELRRELEFEWPPRTAVEFTVGGRTAGRAPLFVSLQPLSAREVLSPPVAGPGAPPAAEDEA